MQALSVATAKLASTGVFEVLATSPVTVYVVFTDTGADTVAMEMSIDKGTNWVAYTPDGTAEAFDTTLEVKTFEYLPGGWQYRFTNVANAEATTVYVGGEQIRLL